MSVKILFNLFIRSTEEGFSAWAGCQRTLNNRGFGQRRMCVCVWGGGGGGVTQATMVPLQSNRILANGFTYNTCVEFCSRPRQYNTATQGEILLEST